MNTKRCILALLLATSVLLTAVLLTPGSYAWFVFKSISPTLGMNASDGNITDLLISSYELTDGVGEYTWDHCKVSTDNRYEGRYDGSFNFGKIDNVASISDGNIVYLKLCVPVKAGTGISFSLSYFLENGQRYRFYKGNRIDSSTVEYTPLTAEKDPQLFERLYDIENGFTDEDGIEYPPCPFIAYDYAFSKDDVIPTEFEGEVRTVTDEHTIVTVDYGDRDTGDGMYYLFVRLMPNLDAYVESVNYIFDYMPCILDFNLEFSYTLHS